MKLVFNRKNMDIGTSEYLWMRAVMTTSANSADVSECLHVLERIKKDDDLSWVNEWNKFAKTLQKKAENIIEDGQIVDGRNAMLRSSNYYRTALMRCSNLDSLADELLSCSRACFETATKYFDPMIEVIRIPCGDYVLPGYFISAGKSGAPTLIGLNGGDSTNEEMMAVLGFAAREHGWNFLVFEGPGQYTARQLNPGHYLQYDYEVPTGAAIDWLLKREEVDQKKIAAFGWSLSSNLVVRAAAFDKRIAAIISNGLIVNVYEAWYGVWPNWLKHAKPKNFDRIFRFLEKISSQVRALTSTFYKMHGVSTPTEMINAWKPFDVSDLADKLHCPSLFITGEAEYAEQSAGPLILSIGRFLKDLKAPAWFHEFGYEDGWAAAHCQIGAQIALQEIVFDWLDGVLIHTERMNKQSPKWHDFKKVEQYFCKSDEIKSLLTDTHIRSF